MKISDVLNDATKYLISRGVASPRLDAEVLLAHCLSVDRVRLYVNAHRELDLKTREDFGLLIERRGRGEPVAYLTGVKEFMGLEFQVTPAVLIPRPETELLVEKALGIMKCSLCREMKASGSAIHNDTMKTVTNWVLEDSLGSGANRREAEAKRPAAVDVGTGSGAIAVTLARELPELEVFAIDASGAALEVARLNAARHGVAERITLLCGDLLRPLPESAAGGIDLIAANLPYIPSGDMAGLMPDVGLFEPKLALDGGGDGLELYRRLIPMAEEVLAPGGYLLMEIGPGQGVKLSSMLGKGWRYNIIPDLAGRERLVVSSKECEDKG